MQPGTGPGLWRGRGGGGRECRALPGPGVVSGGGVWESGCGRFPAGLAEGQRGKEACGTRQRGRRGECRGQAKARGCRHVLPKPPEPGHRGQGLCPGDGVQTRPLPTQPLKRPAGGERPESLPSPPPAPAVRAAGASRPARARRGAETRWVGCRPEVVDLKSQARTVCTLIQRVTPDILCPSGMICLRLEKLQFKES